MSDTKDYVVCVMHTDGELNSVYGPFTETEAENWVSAKGIDPDWDGWKYIITPLESP
jgi:hypothetical protein